MDQLMVILTFVAAVLALLFSVFTARKILTFSEGTDRMKRISRSIRKGANAFLKRQYKIVIVFFGAMFIILGAMAIFGLLTPFVPFAFLTGGFFSALSGFIGMKIATASNARTANACAEGLNRGLRVAFSAGSVMGFTVVGLGLFDISLWFFLLKFVFKLPVEQITAAMLTFGMGASCMALFARVGGGIFTKAADVGADLVGKVEAGIPEDDPRNPAVIADNVGDNVGDVAGMGADLFESYAGAIISAITLGVACFKDSATPLYGALYPLIIAAIGVFASMTGTLFVRTFKSDPHKSLKTATYVASVIVLMTSIIFSYVLFNSFGFSLAVISGVIVGTAIGMLTEVYTSDHYKAVKKIAEQSETGSATNIISGMAVGLKSTAFPIILICVGIFIAYECCKGGGDGMGIYGVALAAVGMLSTTGITVAVDAYGPIADNAGGIAEMSGLDKSIREITDRLDSVGNTTAAMGKGFAIGSAALTALALFFSYAESVNLKAIGINLLNYQVVIGLLIGGVLPFVFSAFTMESVSKAAYEMIEEVRRQFREIPCILEGTSKPDYKTCVAISTKAALKEMIIPGLLAVLSPVVVGVFLGVAALGGLLAGSLITGVLLAIFMSNSGGAWDNAKKFIETGTHGGKGSTSHKAAVVGDTVGDPFKDTSGPSINILVKLMSVVSLVFAPLFMMINAGQGIFM